MAALGYVLGITQSKEYAEPEWYVDLWLTVVWVFYLIAFGGTIIRREEPHIYVANWFFLAFIITVLRCCISVTISQFPSALDHRIPIPLPRVCKAP
jgi:cytochrome c oxidase cbb3-type subunit I